MSTFQGKVALVTGSGRGIGRAIALHLAGKGADVAVNFFRNRQPAEETATRIRALDRQAVALKANVGDLEQLNKLFEEVQQTFGRLDLYIHNAASGFNRSLLEQRPRGWEWTMDINARSFLFGTQHAAAMMMHAGGGHIVALTSLGSGRVLPDYAAVGASKAALEALIRYSAAELGQYNINVNGVSPGLVETDALQHFESLRDEQSPVVEAFRQKTPRGRLCTPQDVAEVVAFLCSPAAEMISGQVIVVDGGYSLLAF